MDTRNEDHAFFCISGSAVAKVDGEEMMVVPGCALYVSERVIHSFKVLGGEVFGIVVDFAPPRNMLKH